MSTAYHGFVVHPFTAPLDMTSAPTALSPGGVTRAENAEYVTHITQEGRRLSYKKRLGTAAYNATAISGTPTITAMADFWRHGASLSPAQKFVAHAGTQLWKDDGDGVWDSIGTGWGTSDSQTTITIAQGYAVFFNGVDDPQTWNQTTLADLHGAPVQYGGGIYHLRRLLMYGDADNPSRVDYTAAGDITDRTGGDTGNFIFDEDDGDRVMGLSRPWRSRVFVFKGPNEGSIHQISGRTPTSFSKDRLFSGAPCVSHRGIITTPNDVYWASRWGFHSLTATDKYGDTEEAFLSRPIQSLFKTINFTRMHQIVSFYHPTRDLVGWAFPTGSNTQCDTVAAYNYAVGGWTVWKFSFKVASFMVGLTPITQTPRLYLGGYDGVARAGEQTALSDDSATAISMKIRTPTHLRFSDAASELQEKTIATVTSFVQPTGSYTAALTTTVGATSQSDTISLSPGSTDLIDDFVMDESLIGSENELAVAETIVEGRGKGVGIEWTQSGVNQDFELYGYGLRFEPGEDMPLDATQ